MGANQIAAIVFAIVSLTFAGRQMANEPVYNVPPPQPAEVRVVLVEDGASALRQSEARVVQEIVIKSASVATVEQPKPNLTVPALLMTLAILVFGGD